MRLLLFIIAISLTACGSNSSPEGRMTNKVEELRKELDSLKMQNASILDSLGKINQHLQKIEGNK